jgi:putative transposase
MKSFKYRIYPNKHQEAKLIEILSVNRQLYNACLNQKIELYKKDKTFITSYDQFKYIKSFNIQNIDSVYSQVLQSTIMKLGNSFTAFFTRIKRGEKSGFPRFKSSDRYNSFTYPQTGFKLNDDKHLKLSKIGIVKIKLHRPMEGIIKTCTVIKDSLNHWYVCFTVETPVKNPSKVKLKNKVGIDLGCKTFAALSNGTTYEHPHYYRQSEEKLASIQSKYSSLKQRPVEDKKKIKVKHQLNKIHEKIKNQRNDFLHKLSTKLVHEHGIIYVEDLNIKKMTRDSYKNLNKSIHDSGWNTFIEFLMYKAEEAGTQVVKVNPAYTSQICSSCGTIDRKELSDRIHSCSCGCILDRDVNAAKNILSFGTKLGKG